MNVQKLVKTTEPAAAPAGSSTVLATVPLSLLGFDTRDVLMLTIHDIDWGNWVEHARARAAHDDGAYERSDSPEDESRWEAHADPHPPHVSWSRSREGVLAGADETGTLRRLSMEHAELLSEADIEAKIDADDLSEEEREGHETTRWCSRIGGEPAFLQATLRARSRKHGTLLPFRAQIRGDVAYDPFGYCFYVFGDPETDELSITYQR